MIWVLLYLFTSVINIVKFLSRLKNIYGAWDELSLNLACRATEAIARLLKFGQRHGISNNVVMRPDSDKPVHTP